MVHLHRAQPARRKMHTFYPISRSQRGKSIIVSAVIAAFSVVIGVGAYWSTHSTDRQPLSPPGMAVTPELINLGELLEGESASGAVTLVNRSATVWVVESVRPA
jgi:hypothetical protein